MTPDLLLRDRVVAADIDMGPYEWGIECDGDSDGSGVVDVFDLLEVLTNWGACPGVCPPACVGDIADVNGAGPDCAVDVFDLLLVLASWGDCSSSQSTSVPTSVSDCLQMYEDGSVEQIACLETFAKISE